MSERRMLKGKRKWWTLWIKRYPDYPAPDYRELLRGATELREKQIQDIVFNSTPLTVLLKGRKR